MSSRYYGKGSSRSTRDDSRGRDERPSRDREERPSRDREERHNRDRERERSRSPRRHSPSRDRRSQEKSRYRTTDSDHHDKFSDSSADEVPAPPPPPRITKISMGFAKPQAPIKMSLGNTSKASIVPKPTLASVFNADDDEDEPEEMPAEARMRMRNIGRTNVTAVSPHHNINSRAETPTSAGPNSFGKTKQGFCDAKKVFEKNLKEALDTADSKSGTSKFPQTIYRIKGP